MVEGGALKILTPQLAPISSAHKEGSQIERETPMPEFLLGWQYFLLRNPESLCDSNRGGVVATTLGILSSYHQPRSACSEIVDATSCAG
jgi:hypothetical protein